jgi:hypothetical protein
LPLLVLLRDDAKFDQLLDKINHADFHADFDRNRFPLGSMDRYLVGFGRGRLLSPDKDVLS